MSTVSRRCFKHSIFSKPSNTEAWLALPIATRVCAEPIHNIPRLSSHVVRSCKYFERGVPTVLPKSTIGYIFSGWLFGRIASGTFAIGHYLAVPYLTLDAPDAPPMAAITIGQSTASVAFDGMVSVFDAVTDGEYQVRPPVNVAQIALAFAAKITVVSLEAGSPASFRHPSRCIAT